MNGNKRRVVHEEFQAVINRNSLENDSNTPDWMLADYLIACLDAWNETTQQREKFYGRAPKPIPVSQWPKEQPRINDPHSDVPDSCVGLACKP